MTLRISLISWWTIEWRTGNQKKRERLGAGNESDVTPATRPQDIKPESHGRTRWWTGLWWNPVNHLSSCFLRKKNWGLGGGGGGEGEEREFKKFKIFFLESELDWSFILFNFRNWRGCPSSASFTMINVSGAKPNRLNGKPWWILVWTQERIFTWDRF